MREKRMKDKVLMEIKGLKVDSHYGGPKAIEQRTINKLFDSKRSISNELAAANLSAGSFIIRQNKTQRNSNFKIGYMKSGSNDSKDSKGHD